MANVRYLINLLNDANKKFVKAYNEGLELEKEKKRLLKKAESGDLTELRDFLADRQWPFLVMQSYNTELFGKIVASLDEEGVNLRPFGRIIGAIFTIEGFADRLKKSTKMQLKLIGRDRVSFSIYLKEEQAILEQMRRKVIPLLQQEEGLALRQGRTAFFKSLKDIEESKSGHIRPVLVLIFAIPLLTYAVASLKQPKAPIKDVVPVVSSSGELEFRAEVVQPLRLRYQFKSRGLKNATQDKRGLYVLRHTTGVAALIELGFISNDEEARALSEPDAQQKAAEGIAGGIITYCKAKGLASPRVALFPGHGAGDPGAVNKTAMHGRIITEHEIVRNVTRIAEGILREYGVNVKWIAPKGATQTLRLRNRCEAANRFGADLVVSVHCNSARNRSAVGIETWCLSAAGMEMAQCLQSATIASLNRGYILLASR